MDTLKKIVLSAALALGLSRLPSVIYAHDAHEHHQQVSEERKREIDDKIGRKEQLTEGENKEIIEYWSQRSERETNERLKKDLAEHLRQEQYEKAFPNPQVVYVETGEQKKDTRSDLQKVRDGIKGKKYCDVYSLALDLYVKHRNDKKPKETKNPITKLFKKEKKTVSAEEYRDLAVTACNECMKERIKSNNNCWPIHDRDPIFELDRLRIGNWESYILLAEQSNSKIETEKYINIAAKKNKEKTKKYIIRKWPKRAIEYYNIDIL